MVGNDSNGWTRRADQCINITWNKHSTSKYGQERGMSVNQPIETQEQKTLRAETLIWYQRAKRGPWNADNSTPMLDHANTHAVPKMLTLDKKSFVFQFMRRGITPYNVGRGGDSQWRQAIHVLPWL